jgi:hypothetical protein
LFNKFKHLEKKNNNNYYGELSADGRVAKAAGGHFKYLQKLNEEKELEKEKDKYDLAVKKWTYKSRYVPYVLSLIAVVISSLVYFNNLSKDATISELKNGHAILENKVDSITRKLKETILNSKNSQSANPIKSDSNIHSPKKL